MTQADFLTSISPDQLAAFTATRDAIQAANAAQNLELAAAKESDFDKERTANAAALEELQKKFDAANVSAASAATEHAAALQAATDAATAQQQAADATARDQQTVINNLTAQLDQQTSSANGAQANLSAQITSLQSQIAEHETAYEAAFQGAQALIQKLADAGVDVAGLRDYVATVGVPVKQREAIALSAQIAQQQAALDAAKANLAALNA